MPTVDKYKNNNTNVHDAISKKYNVPTSEQ